VPRRSASGLATEDDDLSAREAALRRLADCIALEGRRLLVVTGAGLSCASGIPPFRRSKRSDGFGNDDAVWAQHVEETVRFCRCRRRRRRRCCCCCC
jgi:NAD-dependent SIR2 family protein deacetylase